MRELSLKVNSYLLKNRLSKFQFSQKAGISRVTLNRILSEKKVRLPSAKKVLLVINDGDKKRTEEQLKRIGFRVIPELDLSNQLLGQTMIYSDKDFELFRKQLQSFSKKLKKNRSRKKKGKKVYFMVTISDGDFYIF